jgi:peptide/nickel transport system substrate-binding protein
MKFFKILALSLLVLILIFPSCDSKSPSDQNRIVIGISADVQTFNPLFAFSVDEGSIVELLYLSLVDFRWNNEKGELESFPMLAENWEWAEDSSSVKFFLREDSYWTDSAQLTSADVVYSFDVYSDPEVQSRLYGTFVNLFTDDENHIDVERTFNIISEFEFEINFPPNSVPNFFEISFPIVPEHIYGSITKEELETSEFNFNPVSSGPFKLKKWDRNQAIILEQNKESFLIDQNNVNELVFKILPDYTTRIIELKKGEIDLMELVKTEDIKELEEESDLYVVPIVGREYDYIGWNNIDVDAFIIEGQVKPNNLFANENVRRALTYAINRQEIIDVYLLGYGELAVTPISPIFKNVIDENIKPYDFNPDKARELLAAERWIDTDNNGVLDKENVEFSFTLVYPSGNPLRIYASTIIKNNLKAVGVDMNLERMEIGTFIDNLFEKKLDAWMAAWYIPIPVELKPYWYSNLESSPLNFVNYQNKETDIILDELEKKISDKRKKELLQQFQAVMHNNEPVTFLYWVPNICAYNNRLENINITPLGVVTHCWEWAVNN